MLIAFVVAGLVFGGMLALVTLSAFARVNIPELHTASSHTPRVRPHATPHAKHEDRFPPVPPPLAPMSETPKVLGPSHERVLPPLPPLISPSSAPFESVPVSAAPIVSAAPFVFGAVTVSARPEASGSVPMSASPVVPVIAASVPTPPVSAPARKPPPPPVKKAVKFVVDAAHDVANDPELLRLLEDGHYVAAMQRYRKQHGVGVEEAKAALDALRAKSEVGDSVADAVEAIATDPQIVAAIRRGKIVEAIKLYRAKTGLGLQDAKAAIDEWRRRLA